MRGNNDLESSARQIRQVNQRVHATVPQCGSDAGDTVTLWITLRNVEWYVKMMDYTYYVTYLYTFNNLYIIDSIDVYLAALRR